MNEDAKELTGGLTEEMRRVERLEEAKRYFGVPAENLLAEMRAAAERAAAAKSESAARFERLSTNLAEIKSMIPISFTQLSCRIRSLETENADLRSCLERFESPAR